MADISIFDDSGGIKVFQINLKGHTNDMKFDKITNSSPNEKKNQYLSF